MYFRPYVPVVALSSLCLLAACGEPPPPREISAAESGQTIELQRGQDMTLTLDTETASGNSWKILKSAKGVLDSITYSSFSTIPTADHVKGGTGNITWHYRAARKGEDTLRFSYEGGAPPAEGDTLVRAFEAVVQVK